MAKELILIVEDEEDIQELIAYNLQKEGYSVRRAASGEQALKEVKSHAPRLVILDLMLPGIDGLEVCRVLKRDPKSLSTPILILSAKGEESDVVAGLELGADDYMTKPFSPKVLVARIRNILRRKASSAGEEDSPIRIHELVIHPGRHEALVNGEQVELSFTEFRVLQFLARRPGWVFTRNQIIEAVRGDDYPVTDRSVDVQIVGLRRKLGDSGKHIETVRGIGYRFRE